MLTNAFKNEQQYQDEQMPNSAHGMQWCIQEIFLGEANQEGLGDRSSPVGSRGEVPKGIWGLCPQKLTTLQSKVPLCKR
jgi:hypothetical protein